VAGNTEKASDCDETSPVNVPETRTLVVAGVVVLAVLAVAFGGWLWYDAQQRHALAAHAEVMARVSAAQGPPATPEARAAAERDLEALITRYPSSATVGQAAYELGNLRYAARKYPEARAAYEIALARGASGTIRTLARAAVGHTWEAEGNFARAIDTYQALAKDLDAKQFLYEDTLLDLARAQEQAGRKADAVATYQRALKEVPGSRRAEEIKIRLASLAAAAK
jgi:tetratricopeptide (TPR) repeat protein